MKTNPLNSGTLFRWTRLMLTALVAFSARADGELDSSFAPPTEFQRIIGRLRVFQGSAYLIEPGSSTNLYPVRLREDGSVDAAWRLEAPLTQHVLSLEPTPFGGWFLYDLLGGGYVEHSDGSFQRLRALPNHAVVSRWFPQNDGTVVIGGLNQIGADGAEIPSFARFRRLVFAPFTDLAGLGIFGNVESDAVQDRQGRFIVVGNFREVSGVPRLGLVRFLRSGQADPSWNPGPALGITLNETNAMNMWPESVSLGPDDSVVVGLRLVSTNGAPDFRLARISAAGVVEAVFKNYSRSTPWSAPPIVQPDGRILVAGTMEEWEGAPVSGLVRLLPNGALDPEFNLSLTGGSTESTVMAMDHDGSGRVWFSGNFAQVNGVDRAGLARIFAWGPQAAAPELTNAFSVRRVATGEVLLLAADVLGSPPIQLQWYRENELIEGATHRGLRLPVNSATRLGTFRLVASNEAGVRELEFPAVTLAARSPRPGGLDPNWTIPVPGVPRILEIIPVADGRILLVTGDYWLSLKETDAPMLMQIMADGRPDPEFGEQGVVLGNGAVQTLRPLPGGGWLAAGLFSRLAGEPAVGLAELDRYGRRVARRFPAIEPPHLTTALPLPDGGYVIAGGFTRVDGVAAHYLARLKPDLTLDSSFQSPLLNFQMVNDLLLDPWQRLLIAGEEFLLPGGGTLTNPPPTGLRRLRNDGSLDPNFEIYTGRVRTVQLEPEGSLLIGYPPVRLDLDGKRLVEFEVRRGDQFFHVPGPDHRFLRTPLGGVVSVRSRTIASDQEVIRWNADGFRDDVFSALLWRTPASTRIDSLAWGPDGAVLLATSGAQVSRLHRLALDSDYRLESLQVIDGQFRAELRTLPGRSYRVSSRPSLAGASGSPQVEIEGSGYIEHLSFPAEGGESYWELRRD